MEANGLSAGYFRVSARAGETRERARRRKASVVFIYERRNYTGAENL
jgi:hypothetical protein